MNLSHYTGPIHVRTGMRYVAACAPLSKLRPVRDGVVVALSPGELPMFYYTGGFRSRHLHEPEYAAQFALEGV